jgi:hypothetical protein
VQNLMALRFGNALFEPLWRRESIANIQITLAEGLGVGTRGDFYDRTGALRDMVQNHALQLLTMIAMEPPATNDADAIRDEKLKVLRRSSPSRPRAWRATWCAASTAPARSTARRCPGYLDEQKVPAGSRCETFVALRTEVQNWRWAGVPFYLRTGKRLAARDAQIVVNFRPRCRTPSSRHARANKLVIKLQPEDGLELHLLAAKGGGNNEALSPVSLDLDFDKAFASEPRGRLRAPAARRHRRPPEPVRAQRRAGAGLALGGAGPARPGRRPGPARGPMRRQLGPGRGQRAGGARRLCLGRGEYEPPVPLRLRRSPPGGRLPARDRRSRKRHDARSLALTSARTPALHPCPAAGRAARGQAAAGRPAQLCHAAGGRAGRTLARQQAHGGALLPQRGLRRAGRLQAQAGRQRQRRRALRAPRGRRGRQGRRHHRQGDRQRGGALLRYRNAAASQPSSAPSRRWPRPGRDGRRIEFYGVGNSGIVAQDAQHKFFRLGVRATAVATATCR